MIRIPSLPIANWATVVSKDQEIQAIAGYLKNPESGEQDLPEWFRQKSSQEKSRFVSQGGDVIYRGFPPRDRSRWMVPRILREALVAKYHRGAVGAHLGVNKLNAQISLKFYWPSMISTIKKVIQECERCQRSKMAPRAAKIARMLNREALWATMALDFFGPLPRTARGNMYVLVAIDHFSRWPEAAATRVATAAVVAHFLHHRIFPQHGCPREILTDHGSHFASQVIATLCQRYKIRRLMSTPYTPQGNGIVERFMGYLKNSLITLIDQHPKTWDEHLPAILLAYRSTPHPEVGDTPFFLNKGYDPLIPEMLALDAPIKKHRNDSEWLQELQRARASLEEKIAVQQQRVTDMIQESHSTQLQPGQVVLVRRTPGEIQAAHTKLTDKYDRPARVRRVMPNGVAYELVYLQTGDKAIVNRRNLRPFYEDKFVEDQVFPIARTTSLPIAPIET